MNKMLRGRSGWVEKIAQTPAAHRIQDALARQAEGAAWWQMEGVKPKPQQWKALFRQKSYQPLFLKVLRKSRRTGKPVQFDCPTGRQAVCFPIQRGGQVQGYLGFCAAGRPVPAPTVELAAAALDAVAREAEKSEEIRTLSETIQPRCVALSTIHTIHRLISSTLNLEELLPRVARLCCQVLRADACVIWLIDKEKPQLLFPRAVVNVKKGRSEPARPSRMGSGLVGRVASTCKAHLTGQRMVVPLVEEECIGVIGVRRMDPGRPFSLLDQEILTTLAEQAVVAIRNAQMYETQERVTWGTIRSLSAILDGMDSYSPSTVSGRKIMADVALEIAQEMEIPAAQRKSIQYAALLHDAGRVGIPAEILRKPTKLEPAEFDKVKLHTVRGATLLEPLEILEPAVPIILYHHERFDGTGYPKGLKKEAIPLGARILAVANAFEAMVCERPYRKAMPVHEAAKEIASHSGTQFDPKVVEAFLSVVRSGKLDKLFAARPAAKVEHGIR